VDKIKRKVAITYQNSVVPFARELWTIPTLQELVVFIYIHQLIKHNHLVEIKPDRPTEKHCNATG
jgi:hypothetical protein